MTLTNLVYAALLNNLAARAPYASEVKVSKPKLWVSYAWDDNRDGDVDFVCQQIKGSGIEVRIDRTTLGAGRRLWPQIERFITDPGESDAWAFYATQTSIAREACKEELAYALDRALRARGNEFPLIAITPAAGDIELFPAAIRTRLCVSLEDEHWLERVKAAVEDRLPNITPREPAPFVVKVHRTSSEFLIEVRPRVGRWHPFFLSVPVDEKDRIGPSLLHAASGSVPLAAITSVLLDEANTADGKWFLLRSGNQATPSESFFLRCKEIPSQIDFGEFKGNACEGYVVPRDQFTVMARASMDGTAAG